MKAPHEDHELVEVHAHSGARGEEEPRAVTLGSRRLEVEAILSAWREPGGRHFEVRLEDGTTLRLLCAEPDLEWYRLR